MVVVETTKTNGNSALTLRQKDSNGRVVKAIKLNTGNTLNCISDDQSFKLTIKDGSYDEIKKLLDNLRANNCTYIEMPTYIDGKEYNLDISWLLNALK